jgi:hypothetical protein
MCTSRVWLAHAHRSLLRLVPLLIVVQPSATFGTDAQKHFNACSLPLRHRNLDRGIHLAAPRFISDHGWLPVSSVKQLHLGDPSCQRQRPRPCPWSDAEHHPRVAELGRESLQVLGLPGRLPLPKLRGETGQSVLMRSMRLMLNTLYKSHVRLCAGMPLFQLSHVQWYL